MNSFFDWDDTNLYAMQGRMIFLLQQPKLDIYDTAELEDLKVKIENRKKKDEENENYRKEIYENNKQKKEEETLKKEIEKQHKLELFKNNINILPTMHVDLKTYIDSFLNIDDNIKNNIKKFINLIQDDEINHSNDSYLHELIVDCIDVNKNNYIYKKNTVKMIVEYVKCIIEKLKIKYKDQYEMNKNKERVYKNDWAKQKFHCEFCGKEMIKAHKSRHLNSCKYNSDK
jgi:hypothetical protein